MMKIIKLCPVCGGKGRFFNQNCPSCKGQSGSLLKLNKEIRQAIELNRAKFNEQENRLLEYYLNGFPQDEIARESDLTLAKTLLLFHQIEKKINST